MMRMVPLEVRSRIALPPLLTSKVCFSGPPGISLLNALMGAFKGILERMLLVLMAGFSTTTSKLAFIAFGTYMVMFPRAASAVT